jgi:hypothetical protein
MNDMKRKYDRNECIGNLLYRLGFKYGASTDIGDNLSLGYGKLDDNGFWQYPIRTKPFSHIVISFFWQYESVYRSFFSIVKEYRSPYKKERYNLKWREEVQYAKMICEFPKIRRRNV